MSTRSNHLGRRGARAHLVIGTICKQEGRTFLGESESQTRKESAPLVASEYWGQLCKSRFSLHQLSVFTLQPRRASMPRHSRISDKPITALLLRRLTATVLLGPFVILSVWAPVKTVWWRSQRRRQFYYEQETKSLYTLMTISTSSSSSHALSNWGWCRSDHMNTSTIKHRSQGSYVKVNVLVFVVVAEFRIVLSSANIFCSETSCV